MKTNKLFSIGEISRICGVATSALRHYDKIGVIKPAHIDGETKYRYYDDNTILFVGILRYYQKLGFQLDEVQTLLERVSLDDLRRRLLEQDQRLGEHSREIVMQQASLRAWAELVDEAVAVLDGARDGVELRYIEADEMMYCDPEIRPYTKFKHLLVNSDFGQTTTNHRQISYGPLYASFPSLEARLQGKFDGVRLSIHRHPLNPPAPNVARFGGWQAVTAYHKHGFDTIGKTYDTMQKWAEEHRFELRGDAMERYVIDLWSSNNEELYVTELLLPLK